MAEKSSVLKRIRSRVSYREYVEFAKLLSSEPTLKELVVWLNRKLDSRHTYGSETNSVYAYESLTQFIKEWSAEAVRVIPIIDGSEQLTAEAVVSNWFHEWKKCPRCNWEVETLYSFPEKDIDVEGLCANCFVEMILETGMKILKRNEAVWNKYQKLTASGSGRHTNCVLDCSLYEEIANNGSHHPKVKYISKKCCSKIKQKEEQIT